MSSHMQIKKLVYNFAAIIVHIIIIIILYIIIHIFHSFINVSEFFFIHSQLIFLWCCDSTNQLGMRASDPVYTNQI